VAEPNERATIRQLPDGDALSGHIEGREEHRLRVKVAPCPNSAEFRVGSLVEVQCERFLYLGVVIGFQEPMVLVAIEHAMDRATLDVIQNVWHSAPEV
jgi:hypothetical protein